MKQVTFDDITIEQEYAIWELQDTAPIGGTYMGTFKFRCYLTPIQMIEADRDYRFLLGDHSPNLASETVENYAYSLAQLKQRVVQAPPFWNDGSRFPGGNVKDKEIIALVFEAAIQAELKYRSQLEKRHKLQLEKLSKYIEKQNEINKLAEEMEEMGKTEPPSNETE
jgi:hypothetical protein